LNLAIPIMSDILDDELFIKIDDINHEKVTVLALIKLRQQHEAYTSIPRQNRSKLRSRLDNLLDSNNQQSLNIPNITIANINETHMIKQGGFAIAYYEKKN
ncbi:8941_t:CDS:2, partial [Gigaspora rosea]